MKRVSSYIVAALFGAVLVFALMRGCQPKPVVDIRYIKGDSVPYIVYKDKPIPQRITYMDTIMEYDTTILDGDTVYVEKAIDTAALMKDYFASVYYTDTLKNDSSALIVLSETIHKNRVANRELWFQNKRQTAVLQYNKKAFVVGMSVTPRGADVSLGARIDRNVFSVVYGSGQVGVRYQREFKWGK